jgi:hypothetical protein
MTPGMKPFPATDSKTNCFSPALVSAFTTSEQVVTLRQVPTIAACEVALFPAARCPVRAATAPVELLAAITRGANSTQMAKPGRT